MPGHKAGGDLHKAQARRPRRDPADVRTHGELAGSHPWEVFPAVEPGQQLGEAPREGPDLQAQCSRTQVRTPVLAASQSVPGDQSVPGPLHQGDQVRVQDSQVPKADHRWMPQERGHDRAGEVERPRRWPRGIPDRVHLSVAAQLLVPGVGPGYRMRRVVAQLQAQPDGHALRRVPGSHAADFRERCRLLGRPELPPLVRLRGPQAVRDAGMHLRRLERPGGGHDDPRRHRPGSLRRRFPRYVGLPLKCP
mmetsp:Transcript_59876/g.98787  ORF Transcript_59876/g.98787 Transcript_59876/m.98787 type:complete len:250 (+) Transcript_59876:1185-1934(+)